MKKKMLKNTLWLKNRYDFLKSYIKLLKEKDITETVNNEIISSEIFKNLTIILAIIQLQNMILTCPF